MRELNAGSSAARTERFESIRLRNRQNMAQSQETHEQFSSIKWKIFHDIKDNETCNICFKRMKWYHRIAVINCSHHIHYTCMKSCAKINKDSGSKCPNCRRCIFKKNEACIKGDCNCIYVPSNTSLN